MTGMQRRDHGSKVLPLREDLGEGNRGINGTNNSVLFDYIFSLQGQGVLTQNEMHCVMYAFNGEVVLPDLPKPIVDRALRRLKGIDWDYAFCRRCILKLGSAGLCAALQRFESTGKDFEGRDNAKAEAFAAVAYVFLVHKG